MTKFSSVAVSALLATGSIQAAQAAPRTYVSGTGSGTVCSRAAPCATFQAAHDVTDFGGEINCVDAGEFSAVVIAKSITIDCAGTVGGIAAGGGGFFDGLVSIANPNIVVRLRNLTINGKGTGRIGINFAQGAALFVENCIIANFNGGVAGEGIGIKFQPGTGTTTELHIADSRITGNGRPADGGGIIVQPAGTAAVAVTIEHTLVENNTYGIFANGTGGSSTGVISMQVHDSVAAANVLNGISAYTTDSAALTSITVERSSSLLNGSDGVLARSTQAFVTLADSTVMSNGIGLHRDSGASVFSYQDNQLTGNVTSDAACTPAPPRCFLPPNFSLMDK
jgi:hypothetical protein